MSKNSNDSSKKNPERTIQSKVAVVIPARNEEPRIGKTLESILNQDLKPYRIIVVNDGSSDKTGEIAESFSGVEVINRYDREENLVAEKELAETFNVGLQKLLSDDDCEFILISGGDLIIPKNYLSTIVRLMKENPKIAISSGVIKGEFSIEPRGPGRVVRYDFWKKLGLKYPINYAFEGYLLWKAKSLNYEIRSFSEIVATTQRKTGSEYPPKLYYYYGLGLKALGFSKLYVFFKLLLFAKRNLKGSYHMYRGFFSDYNNLYEPELRKYVKNTQHKNLFKFGYVRRFFSILNN